MCGIFSVVNYENYGVSPKLYKKLKDSFIKGQNRGPEFSILSKYENIYFGFHRLAINGLNAKSNQPFDINNIVLICNGEIYNYKSLSDENNINLTTDSDCEIILHLYKLYGIEYTLNILDGVFSFILYDRTTDQIIVARDPYGVRPLFYFHEENTIGFASELKVLYNVCYMKQSIHNFTPGTYMVITNTPCPTYFYKKYTCFPCINKNWCYTLTDELYLAIINKLSAAVTKRVVGTCERPIGCLLSGGLDSSLVAALVNKQFQSERTFEKRQLKTFSIGLAGSEDLKYARIVATYLNTDHHEIIVSEDDFFNAIPEVIYDIGSYDTTTVRASVGNYLVAKYIKKNTDCKVIFNGDGADELMGGYLYMKKAPGICEFDKECRRLLQDIHMFDVLRSDRCIASHGLEPRTPFLDRQWVEFYLSIDRKIRYETTINHCEKYLIRKAFDYYSTIFDNDLLPKEILWRTKEAFSDGVSGLNKSWFEIIQEKLNIKILDDESCMLKHGIEETMQLYDKFIKFNNPTTIEQAYYRLLYNKHYLNTDHLIEYFWMPKYTNAKDASARTLNIYNEKNSNNDKKIDNTTEGNSNNLGDDTNELSGVSTCFLH